MAHLEDQKATGRPRIYVRAFYNEERARAHLKPPKEGYKPYYVLVDLFDENCRLYDNGDDMSMVYYHGSNYYIPVPYEVLEAAILAQDNVSYVDIDNYENPEATSHPSHHLGAPKP